MLAWVGTALIAEAFKSKLYIGYADELAKSFNVLMAERVSAHVAYYGLALSQVEWQTDNGSENLEGVDQRGRPSLVRALGSRHHFIPPKAYTWQRDVETVHHPGIAFWRPLDLGKLHAHYTPAFNPKGGHDLPVHPCSTFFVSRLRCSHKPMPIE